jgi:hypothetical protein
MAFENKNLSFELHENNMCIKYKYFGELYWSINGIGVDFNYPEQNTKSAWFKRLMEESSCMSSACLGSLFYHLTSLSDESFKEIYGDIAFIVKSNEFKNFINDWFSADGSVFSEPLFFDGKFGRFSNYGDMDFPDNEEDEGDELKWDEQAITIKMNQKATFDDLRGKLFIDEELELKFESELKSVIDLFKD